MRPSWIGRNPLKNSAFKILLFVLTFAMLSSTTVVFATTIQTSGHVSLANDPAKRSWADIKVEYSYPDKVEPGERFYVDINLTYINNENAKIVAMEFHDLMVYIRKPDAKQLVIASMVDTRRCIVFPGGSCIDRISIDAPSNPGEYLVALTWITYIPMTEAYGRSLGPVDMTWNTGEWRDTPKAKLAVQPVLPVIEHAFAFPSARAASLAP